MRQAQLFAAIRSEAERLTDGYIALPEIVPPGLGEQAGVCGALVLAEQVWWGKLQLAAGFSPPTT